jgi:hypothetical protein
MTMGGDHLVVWGVSMNETRFLPNPTLIGTRFQVMCNSAHFAPAPRGVGKIRPMRTK